MLSMQELLLAVDRHRDLILSAERYLWAHPETGYREWETQAYLAEQFKKMGYELQFAGNIPGFFTDVDTGRSGPCVLILGEMDSLLCANHPQANPQTHAVHACGHHAQGAALLGLAAALREANVLDGLCGRIRLCAVPAEELIETGYRETLRRDGVIRYFGGKVEFMYRGYFKDADMALMVHTTNHAGSFLLSGGNNGCVVKNIAYEGVAAHAGGSPQDGVNALYAANLGIQAANALRETFRDQDHVRFHPIITYGGTAVNAIPNRVTMESYVRGASLEIIRAVNRKINRALAASAAAIGANVSLCDRPGYMPLNNDATLKEISRQALSAFLPESEIWVDDEWSTGCTDMGDLSAVMPVIQPYACGATGAGHGNDYYVADPERACVNASKYFLAMLRLLLKESAAGARRVMEKQVTLFPSQQAYFDAIDQLCMDRTAVVYQENGDVLLSFEQG